MFRRLCLITLTIAAVFLATGCLGNPPKQSGVFVTRDGGSNWQASPDLKAKNAKAPKVYPPLEVTAVSVSPVDANLVVAGTGDELYLSTDAAKTWQRLTPKLPTANKAIAVQSVRWHPSNADTFFVGGVAAGYGKVFKSTDRGNSLQDVFSVSQPRRAVTALDVQANDTVYAGDETGSVYKSGNGGAAWQRIFSSTDAISALASSGPQLFIGTRGQGIFRTSDGGATFAAANGSLTGNQLGVWSLSPGFGGLYLATDAGLFLTRDFGASWQSVGNPLPVGTTRVNAVVATGNAVYFAAGAIVYRMSPGGETFSPAQLQLAKEVFGLSYSPAAAEVLYAAGNGDADFSGRYDAGIPGLNLEPPNANP